MVTFDSLLQALYDIQGLTDPGDAATTLAERVREVRAIASKALADSGWAPE